MSRENGTKRIFCDDNDDQVISLFIETGYLVGRFYYAHEHNIVFIRMIEANVHRRTRKYYYYFGVRVQYSRKVYFAQVFSYSPLIINISSTSVRANGYCRQYILYTSVQLLFRMHCQDT